MDPLAAWYGEIDVRRRLARAARDRDATKGRFDSDRVEQRVKEADRIRSRYDVAKHVVARRIRHSAVGRRARVCQDE